MLIVPNAAEDFLQSILKNTFNGPGRIKLFMNDYTPDEDTVEADFDEADFSGYADQASTLTGPTNVGGVSIMNGLWTFAHNGGGTSNTIYGWWITSNFAGLFIVCERLPTPKVMASAADELIVALPWRLRQIP